MFTDLTPFGEPIQKDEFVQHYMELFQSFRVSFMIPSIYHIVYEYMTPSKHTI